MKDQCYLTFGKSGIHAMTKRQPTLGSGEFAVRVTLEVADKFFTQIVPEVQIKVGEDFIIKPEVVVKPELPGGKR